MKVVNAQRSLLSDAEVCAIIRSVRRQQQHRVDCALREAQQRLADDEDAATTYAPASDGGDGDSGVVQRRRRRRPRSERGAVDAVDYMPRAPDNEIIMLANFGSGLQYFSPAAQSASQLRALQQRLLPYIADGRVSLAEFMNICNNRPEVEPVLRCCLSKDRDLRRFAPEEEDDMLRAVRECLSPGSDWNTLGEGSVLQPVDAELALPLPYAEQLGERRTEIDAEMERIETRGRRRQQQHHVPIGAEAATAVAAAAAEEEEEIMRQVRRRAARLSVAEEAEMRQGGDIVGMERDTGATAQVKAKWMQRARGASSSREEAETGALAQLLSGAVDRAKTAAAATARPTTAVAAGSDHAAVFINGDDDNDDGDDDDDGDDLMYSSSSRHGDGDGDDAVDL